MYVSRHIFVRVLIAVLVAPALTVGAQNQRSAATNALRIGLLSSLRPDTHSTSIERGVRLGADEAKQTANLFGNDVQLYTAPAGSNVVATARRLLSERQIQVLIAASAADAEALSTLAEERHILFFNVASPAQSLRVACRRYTFHVDASEAMFRNATLLARRTASPSHGPAARTADNDSIALWEATLERYGASQINGRYRAKYRIGMDDGAWAGWFAVKVASESALRARSTEADKLLVYLESPTTSFDGHKGWPLSFRTADHQLRQPLYLVAKGGTGARHQTSSDVPELRGAAGSGVAGPPARLNQVLDRIIASPTAPRCQWRRL